MAYYTGSAGQVPEALRQFQALLPDQQEVLGAEHPHVLRTEYEIAHWTDKEGHGPEALRRFRQLLPKMISVFGPEHADPNEVREAIERLEHG